MDGTIRSVEGCMVYGTIISVEGMHDGWDLRSVKGCMMDGTIRGT